MYMSTYIVMDMNMYREKKCNCGIMKQHTVFSKVWISGLIYKMNVKTTLYTFYTIVHYYIYHNKIIFQMFQ